MLISDGMFKQILAGISSDHGPCEFRMNKPTFNLMRKQVGVKSIQVLKGGYFAWCGVPIIIDNDLADGEVEYGPQRRKTVSEWQPIETAPKDGTWILTLNSGLPDAYYPYLVARYHEPSDSWMAGFGPSPQDGYQADYWMPLPEAPQEE